MSNSFGMDQNTELEWLDMPEPDEEIDYYSTYDEPEYPSYIDDAPYDDMSDGYYVPDNEQLGRDHKVQIEYARKIHEVMLFVNEWMCDLMNCGILTSTESFQYETEYHRTLVRFTRKVGLAICCDRICCPKCVSCSDCGSSGFGPDDLSCEFCGNTNY